MVFTQIVAKFALAGLTCGCFRWLWLLRTRKNILTFDASSPITSGLARKLEARNLGEYKGVFWLPSGLLQTIYSEICAVPNISFRRDSLPLPRDEDSEGLVDHRACRPKIIPAGHVSIDWIDVDDSTAPIVLLVPGSFFICFVIFVFSLLVCFFGSRANWR